MVPSPYRREDSLLLADYVIQGKVQELVVKFLEVINTSGVTEDAFERP